MVSVAKLLKKRQSSVLPQLFFAFLMAIVNKKIRKR